jgi:hypothetical protein
VRDGSREVSSTEALKTLINSNERIYMHNVAKKDHTQGSFITLFHEGALHNQVQKE